MRRLSCYAPGVHPTSSAAQLACSSVDTNGRHALSRSQQCHQERSPCQRRPYSDLCMDGRVPAIIANGGASQI